jgi:hypothetical protein
MEDNVKWIFEEQGVKVWVVSPLLGSITRGEFLEWVGNYQFLKKDY